MSDSAEILDEATLFSKFLNLMRKDHSQRYKGPEGKKTIDFERSLKKSWNDKVDRNFIESVKLVHWLVSGDPTKFLTTPRNNEISAEGYLPDEPTVSNYAKTQVGVLLDGYVTFAMRSGGGTGFFGGDDTPEEWKSSGTVKRAPESKANRIGQPILNKDSKFRSKGTYNEFIVDNWKPVALVVKGGINNPFYKELHNYSRESGLPIVDENGKQIELQDPTQFSLGKKISTGAKRVAQGAMPVEEGKTMKQIFENWRKHLNEAAYEPDPRLTRGLERSMGPSDSEPEPEPFGPEEEDPRIAIVQQFQQAHPELNIGAIELNDFGELKVTIDGEEIVMPGEEEMYQALRKRAGY